VFDLILFCLENLTPPSPKENDTILQFFLNALLFFGNASAFRKNKLHFLSNPKFLANVMTILDSNEFPLKIKAFAAQTLCVTLHNHQGVKSSWNKQIYEGISKIIYDLEHFDQRKDASYSDNDFNDEFWHKQDQYKQMCIQALDSILTKQ
jgi:hypothetical protein